MSIRFRSFIFSLTNTLYHLCEEYYITMQHHTLIFKTEWNNTSTRIIFSQFASCLTFICEMNSNKEITEIKFPYISWTDSKLIIRRNICINVTFSLPKGLLFSQIINLKFIRWLDVLEIWFVGQIPQSRNKKNTIWNTFLNKIQQNYKTLKLNIP